MSVVDQRPDNNHAGSLPSAEQVKQHLLEHEGQPPSRLRAWLPLLILLGVFMFAISSASPGAQVLPWLALAGVLIYTSVRVRAMKGLEQQVNLTQEAVMVRRVREALAGAWKLLPRLVRVPELHGRIVALIAHALDRLKAHDAAIVGYDYLIERLPGRHPVSMQLQLQRVIAQLACDRLTDADDGLRKLRDLSQLPVGAMPRAMYTMARLIQSVRTGHYDDVIGLGDGLTETIQPLGVEAGYGHALMALSCHQAARQKVSRLPEAPGEGGGGASADELWGKAAAAWSNATLLLPVEDLTERFAEVGALMQTPVIAQATQSATLPDD